MFQKFKDTIGNFGSELGDMFQVGAEGIRLHVKDKYDTMSDEDRAKFDLWSYGMDQFNSFLQDTTGHEVKKDRFKYTPVSKDEQLRNKYKPRERPDAELRDVEEEDYYNPRTKPTLSNEVEKYIPERAPPPSPWICGST